MYVNWLRLPNQFKLQIALFVLICLGVRCILDHYGYTDRLINYALQPFWHIAKEELMWEEFRSIFKTPVQKIKLSQYQIQNNNFHFQVVSPTQPLVMQDGKSIQSIDPSEGILGKERESWMTHCYFRPHDASLLTANGDVWIYTDTSLSKAYLTGQAQFIKPSNTSP